uniref:Uncharacterized protein n=1 Tax=Ditylenchus dipsaci TaxID=166011 RepID=A0A915E0X9_9BILA
MPLYIREVAIEGIDESQKRGGRYRYGFQIFCGEYDIVPFDLKEWFHLFSMLSFLPVVDVLRGYQALLHRFRDLTDRYETTEEEIEKINAFLEYFRKTFLYQSSLIPGGSFREARYKIKIWNSFDSLLTNHLPITNNDAEGSNARYNQHFGGLQKPLRSKVIEWMKSRVQTMEYDIERHEDCPAEKWVRKTLRQQVEESNVRNLLSDWVVMKATLDPSMTPDNSKYIRFLQDVYENFRRRHLLAPIEPFQPDEEQVEVDELNMMGLNLDDIDAPPNEEFPEDEDSNMNDQN